MISFSEFLLPIDDGNQHFAKEAMIRIQELMVIPLPSIHNQLADFP